MGVRDSISPYIENNGDMINFFAEYYNNGVSVDKIVNDINNNKFKELRVFDLSRFRIFLDSCLMVFNKEKLEKEYFKKNFEYAKFEENIFRFNIQKYFQTIKQDDLIQKFCRQTGKDDFSKNPLAVFNPEAERRYDEVARLRISFAHMQYGNFSVVEDFGIIPYYCLYNKDKGKIKNYGIAFEPVIHEFIRRYYSNQATYGIPYKHTFFSNLDENRKLTDSLYFYEITYKFESDDKYKPGDGTHPMIDYSRHQSSPDKIFDFIYNNPNFVVNIRPVNNYEKMKEYKLNGVDFTEKEFHWFMKLLYDFETEFSNFILNLIQLVDILIDLIVKNNIEKLDSEFKEQIKKRVLELREDEDDKVAFQTLFTVLTLYNIMLRVEDDDLENFSGIFIDESQFEYNYQDLVDWCNNYYKKNYVRENDKTDLPRKFILEKIRNALAHGNVCLILSDELKIQLIDSYNSRKVEIKISIDKFKNLIANLNWECH